jgi:phage N-6-adenine-methyltransferase
MNTSFERAKVGSKTQWLTPPYIIKALGPFDIDPCAPVKRPWNTARKHYTIKDNGLSKRWLGRVWCNPPYDEAPAWVRKCATHGNAIVMLFNRLETKWCFDNVWNKADAILFIKGRIRFYHVTGKQGGSPGCGSILVAYGQNNVKALQSAVNSKIPGRLVLRKGK